MKRIFKYVANPGDEVYLPKGYQIVHAEPQESNVCLWCLVDDQEKETIYCRFDVIGTGHAFPPEAKHIASWQDPPFVWHLIQTQ